MSTIFVLLLIISICNCFYLNPYPLNTSNAELFCQIQCNSNLASIHSELENNKILSIINKLSYQYTMTYKSIWFGLIQNNDNTYSYYDNTIFNYGNNTSGGIDPWYQDRPNLNSQHCHAYHNTFNYHFLALFMVIMGFTYHF